MSGVKVKVMVFRTPADITAPGAMSGVLARAQVFADTLYLEREGLPGNLSVLAQRIISLAPLAASDPRSAAEIMVRIGDINRLLAVWPALKVAETAKRNGAVGGSRAKRQPWAEALADKLADQRHPTEDSAWYAIPTPDAAWDIETDAADFEVYAEDGSVIAVNADTREEQRALKKSTFLKNYYRPARRAGT